MQGITYISAKGEKGAWAFNKIQTDWESQHQAFQVNLGITVSFSGNPETAFCTSFSIWMQGNDLLDTLL